MGKHKVDSQNYFFYPLLEWTNRHCGCVEIVEYIPFDYLHDAFGVRKVARRAGPHYRTMNSACYST